MPSFEFENDELLNVYESTRQPQLRIYEPQSRVVILGAAGSSVAEVFQNAVLEDNIPIRRRRGGGGTVLLTPGQVVVALVTEVSNLYQNREYARVINDWLIEALENCGVKGITHRGISDLAIKNRKIVGTSIFRRRFILFYQASVMVDNELSEFERYLQFPVRVPDYRLGRNHAKFCTTLVNAGFNLRVSQVCLALKSVLINQLTKLR